MRRLRYLGGAGIKNGISVTTKTNRELDVAPEAKRSTTGAKKVINQVQEIKTSQIKEGIASKVPKLPSIQRARKSSSQQETLIGNSHKEEEVLTERQREDEEQKKRNLEILARIRERSKRLGR